MAKKNGWFGWVKRLFACKAKTKKGKDWRWDLGRFEHKRYPALTASQRTLSEAAEEQKKHALNVAIATAAAAEAAVAAAQAAAEVVRLTGASKSRQLFRKLDPSLAATKIQSAYRAHLARKAFRALKGLVRLQAIVRGRAVRRQIVASLKRLPSTRKRQQEVQEGSITIGDECSKVAENKKSLKPKKEFEEKELKVECRSQEGWDCSTHSKEDIEASWLKRKDALSKRERMKKYSFSHRERRNTYMLQESLTKKEYGTRSCRLEPWEGHEISKPIVYSNLSNSEIHGRRQAKRQNASHRDSIEMLSPRFPFLRSSFHHHRRNSFEDESFLPSSPAFPTYMAVTESAKAKTRSMSIPKQRVGFWDGCLNDNYPRRNTVSLWSSYDSESIFHN